VVLIYKTLREIGLLYSSTRGGLNVLLWTETGRFRIMELYIDFFSQTMVNVLAMKRRKEWNNFLLDQSSEKNIHSEVYWSIKWEITRKKKKKSIAEKFSSSSSSLDLLPSILSFIPRVQFGMTKLACTPFVAACTLTPSPKQQ
jgi:hypothetical protein